MNSIRKRSSCGYFSVTQDCC